MREIVVSANDAGQRFDKYLNKYFKEASMGFLYKMLRKKNIVLNGKKSDGKDILKEKDVIKVFFSDETFEKLQGMQGSYDAFFKLSQVTHKDVKVVYEDDHILAVNKPAGILSQKSEMNDISLNEEILSYLIEEKKLSKEDYLLFHPSVANRLDRNTSGLLLAGKTLKGQQFLSNALKNRNMTKLYLCLVKGEITKKKAIKGYLIKDEKKNQVTIFDHPVEAAAYIETEYEPLEVYDGYTLLQVHLITGKSHQIRAHLSSITHPIIGDTKYGSTLVNRMFYEKYHLKHQLLHAYSLTLEDYPSIHANPPKEFLEILKDLRKETKETYGNLEF